MERQENRSRKDRFVDARPRAHLAPAALNHDRVPVFQINRCGVIRMDLNIALRFNPIQGATAAGHRAGVVVIEHPAGAQDERIFFVCLLGGVFGTNSMEATSAACELADMENGCAGMILRWARPLKTFIDALGRDASINRSDLGDLFQDLVC